MGFCSRPDVGVYETPASDSGQVLEPGLRASVGDFGVREMPNMKYPCMGSGTADRVRDKRSHEYVFAKLYSPERSDRLRWENSKSDAWRDSYRSEATPSTVMLRRKLRENAGIGRSSRLVSVGRQSTSYTKRERTPLEVVLLMSPAKPVLMKS
jgi:hypothetical protein